MNHKFIAALGLLTLAGISPAWASATLFCEASLKQLDVSLIAIVPYGQGSPLLQVRGEVKASPEGVVPAPAAIELNDASNTQFWLDDDTLNLTFYRESDAGSGLRSALLTITTDVRSDDPAYFDGKLHFEGSWNPAGGTGDPTEVTLDGKVTCSVG